MTGRWAIYSREFGFYAYGKTREEANEDFCSGVTDILNSFDQHERMVAYLSNRDIKYNNSKTSATHKGTTSDRKTEAMRENDGNRTEQIDHYTSYFGRHGILTKTSGLGTSSRPTTSPSTPTRGVVLDAPTATQPSSAGTRRSRITGGCGSTPSRTPPSCWENSSQGN